MWIRFKVVKFQETVNVFAVQEVMSAVYGAQTPICVVDGIRADAKGRH